MLDCDDVKLLSEVANTKIDEVFIGSCMTNIGHFRAVAQLLKDQSELPTELWVAPPTRMDEAQLKKEGVYQTFGKDGFFDVIQIDFNGCGVFGVIISC
jgi:aconitate hydratase 2/2-methylisocitrate dehydratase